MSESSVRGPSETPLFCSVIERKRERAENKRARMQRQIGADTLGATSERSVCRSDAAGAEACWCLRENYRLNGALSPAARPAAAVATVGGVVVWPTRRSPPPPPSASRARHRRYLAPARGRRVNDARPGESEPWAWPSGRDQQRDVGRGLSGC